MEVFCASQDSATFARYLVALAAHQLSTGREIYLVLANGPCHTSQDTRQALAEHSAWLRVIWLAKSRPPLHPQVRE